MRHRRTFTRIAFFVPGALFIACAADPGDVLKLGESATNSGMTATTNPSTGGNTVNSTGQSTGSPSTTGTQTSSPASTGNSTGTGTGASTATSTSSSTSTEMNEDDDASAEAEAPCTTCMVELGYATDNPTGTGSASFEIWLINNGSTALSLNTTTVNYYFTANGLSGFEFDVYTAQENDTAMTAYVAVPTGAGGDVTGAVTAFTPATSTADSVLAITFAAGTPAIPPGEYLYFKGALHDPSYSMNFVQTDDYSFVAADTTQTDNMKIVVDIGGAVVWGTPP